jgi:hypothetical protein
LSVRGIPQKLIPHFSSINYKMTTLSSLPHSNLTAFLSEEFTLTYGEKDEKQLALYLTLKQYMSAKTKKLEVMGAKSSLSIDQLIEYQQTGVVKGAGIKGTDWKSKVSLAEAKWYELRLRHTDRLVCIDVDGSFGQKGDIDYEPYFLNNYGRN